MSFVNLKSCRVVVKNQLYDVLKWTCSLNYAWCMFFELNQEVSLHFMSFVTFEPCSFFPIHLKFKLKFAGVIKKRSKERENLKKLHKITNRMRVRDNFIWSFLDLCITSLWYFWSFSLRVANLCKSEVLIHLNMVITVYLVLLMIVWCGIFTYLGWPLGLKRSGRNMFILWNIFC